MDAVLPATRSAGKVFRSHLGFRKEGRLEEDLAANYAPDVVLVTCAGEFHGHDGVRSCAAELRRDFPGGGFDYLQCRVHGELAFLVWSGRSRLGDVREGADSFVIREGLIRLQTIYYKVGAGG